MMPRNYHIDTSKITSLTSSLQVINRTPLMGERRRKIEKQTYVSTLRKGKEVGRVMLV